MMNSVVYTEEMVPVMVIEQVPNVFVSGASESRRMSKARNLHAYAASIVSAQLPDPSHDNLCRFGKATVGMRIVAEVFPSNQNTNSVLQTRGTSICFPENQSGWPCDVTMIPGHFPHNLLSV